VLGRGMIPTTGRVALHLTVAAMEQSDPAESLPPFEPLPRYARAVLISDFLEPLADLNGVIGRLADRGVTGHLVQVLDPAEETLPFSGRTRFEGMENEGRALIGRVESVRRDYKEVFEEHHAGLKTLARVAGWTFATHITDQPAEAALLGLYTAVAAPRDF
jgi:uncharacterized protein (DUF58 family)